MENRIYAAIDLKSFYASVECRERGLDPLTTHLVVADKSRTDKTICLAVTPSLKSKGIPGRPRLFEVVRRVQEINRERRWKAPNQSFTGSSSQEPELEQNPGLELSYIVAPPRMAFYMEYSTRIYHIYLRYFSPEDIVVYSIDEVLIDMTHYLSIYGLSAHDLTSRVIHEVLEETGITATAGIGTNLFLCKVAMDIVAKHIAPDRDGVRIAQLDEMSFREKLWEHRPITDFWRVGKGYAKKLEAHGIYTMGDIALCSEGKPGEFYNEELLYKLFGVNAELLIDHAWGWEPCTVADIRAYRPGSSSMGSGQVLQCPYTWEKARLVVREMTDLLALELVDKGMVTDQLVLTVGYDIENLTDPDRRSQYRGPITTDRYGRKIPKHGHGTQNLKNYTSSGFQIMEGMMELFDRIADPDLLVRRLTVVANRVIPETEAPAQEEVEQLDLFTDDSEKKKQTEALEKEKKMQQAVLSIQKKFGKNAILKGISLQDGSTARERNSQIGGHKA